MATEKALVVVPLHGSLRHVLEHAAAAHPSSRWPAAVGAVLAAAAPVLVRLGLGGAGELASASVVEGLGVRLPLYLMSTFCAFGHRGRPVFFLCLDAPALHRRSPTRRQIGAAALCRLLGLYGFLHAASMAATEWRRRVVQAS